MIDENKIVDFEPYCKGLRALWSPHTGIVDWALVTRHYADDVEKAGGDIFLNYEVSDFSECKEDSEYPVVIKAKGSTTTLQTKYVLTCAGLQSDKVAELTGCPRSPRIVPIRGEYLLLRPEKQHMVRGNIYPVPDPTLPFLGVSTIKFISISSSLQTQNQLPLSYSILQVHFTPRMDGSIWIGPNAVLAFKREGYKFSDFDLSELIDDLKYPGVMRLGMRHFKFATMEFLRSLSLRHQTLHVQRFIPEITKADLVFGPSGVRAQALDIDGNLVDDFVFHIGNGNDAIGKRVLHCRNAPSPGATSSLAIAKMIADRIETEFRV